MTKLAIFRMTQTFFFLPSKMKAFSEPVKEQLGINSYSQRTHYIKHIPDTRPDPPAYQIHRHFERLLLFKNNNKRKTD